VRTWLQPYLASLSTSQIGAAGAQALAAALPSCAVLTELEYAAVLRKKNAQFAILTTPLPCARGVNPVLAA